MDSADYSFFVKNYFSRRKGHWALSNSWIIWQFSGHRALKPNDIFYLIKKHFTLCIETPLRASLSTLCSRHVVQCNPSACYQFKIWLTFREIYRSWDCYCSSHRLEWHKTRFRHRLTYSCKPGWHRGSLLARLTVAYARWMKFALSQRRGNRKRGLSLAFLFQIVCFRFDRFLPHKRVYAESGWVLHGRALFSVSSE